MLGKVANRIKDITHKATRAVAQVFPNANVVVGKPFNDAARKLGRRQALQVASACNRRIIDQLAYKLAGATQVEEHYTSQTCPVCGTRRRVRRIYRCPCGFEAPRDVVGLTNIRRIGLHGQMVCSPEVPTRIVYALPHRKYPGPHRFGEAIQVVPGEPRHVARSAV
jgi:putative transposase